MSRKYSIRWESKEPPAFEVDRVLYKSLDQIPDADDREKLTALIDGSIEPQFEQEFKDFDKEFAKDWEAYKTTSARMEKIILGIFSGVVVLMLLTAFISSASAILKMNQ
jgi:hypothetical protein